MLRKIYCQLKTCNIRCILILNVKIYIFLRFDEICQMLHLFPCSCWCYHPVLGSHFACQRVPQVCSPLMDPGYNPANVLPPGLYRVTEHPVQYRLHLAHGIKSELLSLAFWPSTFVFLPIFLGESSVPLSKLDVAAL